MSARDEALAAIEKVEAMLTAPDMTALDKRLALSTLQYAAEQVKGIEELKRARRKATQVEKRP